MAAVAPDKLSDHGPRAWPEPTTVVTGGKAPPLVNPNFLPSDRQEPLQSKRCSTRCGGSSVFSYHIAGRDVEISCLLGASALLRLFRAMGKFSGNPSAPILKILVSRDAKLPDDISVSAGHPGAA